jgi:hypothetical protein
MYGIFGRVITNYTVINRVYIRFWATQCIRLLYILWPKLLVKQRGGRFEIVSEHITNRLANTVHICIYLEKSRQTRAHARTHTHTHTHTNTHAHIHTQAHTRTQRLTYAHKNINKQAYAPIVKMKLLEVPVRSQPKGAQPLRLLLCCAA